MVFFLQIQFFIVLRRHIKQLLSRSNIEYLRFIKFWHLQLFWAQDAVVIGDCDQFSFAIEEVLNSFVALVSIYEARDSIF